MRRSFILVFVLSSFVGVHARQSELDPKATLVYIGTYTTRAGAEAKGIYLFKLQSVGSEVFQNVTLVPLGLVAETPNPSHFELDVRRRLLFTVNEVAQFEGKPTGAVSAFAIDQAGKLTLLNQRASMGARPCHLVLDKDSRNVVVANCDSGTLAVLPVAADGRLGEPALTSLARDVPAPSKVEGSPANTNDSARCVALDPASRFVFACDPSSDKIRGYSFDASAGKLTQLAASTSLKAGASPRQMLFRQDGRFAYVLNEKTSSITVFSYDSATGALAEVQTASTLPEYFDGANTAGELHLHRTGKWLYASNIGHNSVVLFTIDPEKGTLSFVEEQGTGGKHPRHFGIEPSSKHLAISNTESDTVLASRIDDGNGRLKPSGIFAALPSPASVRFLPPANGAADK